MKQFALRTIKRPNATDGNLTIPTEKTTAILFKGCGFCVILNIYCVFQHVCFVFNTFFHKTHSLHGLGASPKDCLFILTKGLIICFNKTCDCLQHVFSPNAILFRIAVFCVKSNIYCVFPHVCFVFNTFDFFNKSVSRVSAVSKTAPALIVSAFSTTFRQNFASNLRLPFRLFRGG